MRDYLAIDSSLSVVKKFKIYFSERASFEASETVSAPRKLRFKTYYVSLAKLKRSF